MSTERTISRYCMRCSQKYHGHLPPSTHETNEHDEWLERVWIEPADQETP